MTDGDALLAAVLAAPGDDTPRLVFADWLDEHGRAAKAAFIRGQVAAPDSVVGITPGASFGVSHKDGDSYTLSMPPDVSCMITRGFVEHVTCPWEAFAAAADALLAAHPVRRVVLTTAATGEYVEADGRTGVRLDGYPREVTIGQLVDARKEMRTEWLFLDDMALAVRVLFPRVEIQGPPEENTAYRAGQDAAMRENHRILDAVLRRRPTRDWRPTSPIPPITPPR